MKGITGTFLDEITYDIPSANWGAEDWAADFDAMQAIGIDTGIMSPNSMWPSARNLYQRYREWQGEGQAGTKRRNP